MMGISRDHEARSQAKLRKLADEELMELVRNNEAMAFEIILERHADAAFSLAYRMVGKRQLAEDVVQEAMLSVWRSGTRYDRRLGSVRNWMLGITRNRAIDALRRNGPHERRRASDEGLDQKLEAAEQTESEVLRRDEAHEVRNALSELPEEQVRVIELAYFGGFTHTEIASMLDTPIGTVKGRMRLGLQKMRSRLGTKGAFA